MAPLLLIAPALADEDWEAATFARMLTEAIVAERPDTVLLVPEEVPPMSPGQTLTCRWVALRFGLLAPQVAALAEQHGVREAVMMGAVGQAIHDCLAALGVAVRVVGLIEARDDPGAPPPLPTTPCRLSIDEARAQVDAPPGRPLIVAFPSAGAGAALCAVDALAAAQESPRPLLILADEWSDAELIRQRAVLRGVGEDLAFCGAVPDAHRESLIAAAALVHLGGVGSYRGEAARIAWANATPTTADPPLKHGTATEWANWATGSGRAAVTPSIRVDPVPGIAILLPTWRCRTWLPDAIASVLAQSHPALHLFVCGDGGEDVDAELCARFPEVSFLSTDAQCGPYAIANMLIAATHSDYIAFHDADDVSDPARLSAQVAELARYGLDAVGCSSRVLDQCGTLIGVEARPRAATLAIRSTRADMLLHPTSLFRRSTLERLRGFDSTTRFGADTELHFRAAFSFELGNVPSLLYTRRERPASLTRSRATGFGSTARSSYSGPVHEAFARALAADSPPPLDRTLLGHAIPPVELTWLRWIQAGQGCERWVSQAAAAIRA